MIGKACVCLDLWPVDRVRVLEGEVSEDIAISFFPLSQLIVEVVDVILETVDRAVADAVVVLRKFEVL